MKLFAFALRPYDELGFMKELSQELGFEFGWTTEYPSLENAHLAEGATALSILTNPMTPELLDRYHDMGIRAIATRSIGYDHIDLTHAHNLGMRIGHAAYPPEGVANYAIMLMMMVLRRAAPIHNEWFSAIVRPLRGCGRQKTTREHIRQKRVQTYRTDRGPR